MKKNDLLDMLSTAWGDENARYYVGDGTDGNDFHNGLAPYRSSFVNKDELQRMIACEGADAFTIMPEYQDYIVLNKKRFISLSSIKKQIVYPMSVPTDGMTHVFEQGMPHFDVWFSVDHESKEITFALGDKKKSFKIVENTGWAWKITKRHNCVYTMTSKKLEQDFTDPFWATSCISIGRTLLGYEV